MLPSGAPAVDDISPERIAALAKEFTNSLSRSLKQIEDINREARLLALNARIEAGRAGGATGAAFGVVARAMGDLSGQTGQVASALGQECRIGEQRNRLRPKQITEAAG